MSGWWARTHWKDRAGWPETQQEELMRTQYKAMVVGLVAAALLMSTSVGFTLAGRLSLSHGELVRVRWASLRFQIVGITERNVL